MKRLTVTVISKPKLIPGACGWPGCLQEGPPYRKGFTGSSALKDHPHFAEVTHHLDVVCHPSGCGMAFLDVHPMKKYLQHFNNSIIYSTIRTDLKSCLHFVKEAIVLQEPKSC